MPGTPHAPLSKEQKVGFSLLLIFAFLVVAMGALQIRNTIYGPFAYNEPDAPAMTEDDYAEQEVLRLQAIDTDQDGINDYEEINFYETSPYLPDTDSDGLEDKEELDAGKDPLCPEGQKCSDATAGSATAQVTEDNELLEAQSTTSSFDILSLVGGQPVAQGQGPSQADIDAFLQNPDQIRALLAQTGKVSAGDLEKIPDETLLEIIQKVMLEQGSASGIPVQTGQSVTTSASQSQ